MVGRSSWSGGSGSSSAAVGTLDLLEWEEQLLVLETAINEAKDVIIGMSKAKRLKELQVGNRERRRRAVGGRVEHAALPECVPGCLQT